MLANPLGNMTADAQNMSFQITSFDKFPRTEICNFCSSSKLCGRRVAYHQPCS